MFQAILVAPAILFFDVLETLAFVLHMVPLLIDESCHREASTTVSSDACLLIHLVVTMSVHILRRMSSVWLLLGTTTSWLFNHEIIERAIAC
jgi:hypothetical protein